jgi:hypothetical protein
MRKFAFWASIVVMLFGVLGVGSFALAHGFKKNIKSDHMSGYNEVPALSSEASGKFKASIDDQAQKIDFTLTYQDLEANATQAHIHFGQRDVSGGVVVWLCSNLASPPTPAGFNRPCPLRSGTVTGTIVPTDVSPGAALPAGVQGITPGEFDELVKAIRAGLTYANVHSTTFPGGEIRAQLNDRGGHFGRRDK